MTGSAQHIVVGAGPAGLTAALCLSGLGRSAVVLERHPTLVGGLCRTVVRNGFRFDIGSHRFYSRLTAMRRLWRGLLNGDLLTVARTSSILYRGTQFAYPLSIKEVCSKLTAGESARILGSYLRSRLARRRPPVTLEEFLVSRFGRRMYEMFFRGYSAKLWGIPCARMSSDWGMKRIGAMSVASVLRDLLRSPGAESSPRSLSRSFEYPRRGAGQLWEAVRSRLADDGVAVAQGKRIAQIRCRAGRVAAVRTSDGDLWRGERFHVSMPLREIIETLDPPPPPHILAAARRLRYRSLLLVLVVVQRRDVFDGHWLYVQDLGARAARVTNYKHFSPSLVPDASYTSLGVEYFCGPCDSLWRMGDQSLGALAVDELTRCLPAIDRRDCLQTFVVREPAAYPVYTLRYSTYRELLRAWLERHAQNLIPIGRGGLHAYNSMDHAMLTGLASVRNVQRRESTDLWELGMDQNYAESGLDATRWLEGLPGVWGASKATGPVE